ncbi:MAG: hypothetical protein FWD32_00600 [Firmicutes bacterium]|nr:hypothetical protein [Bacillota bacterium]
MRIFKCLVLSLIIVASASFSFIGCEAPEAKQKNVINRFFQLARSSDLKSAYEAGQLFAGHAPAPLSAHNAVLWNTWNGTGYDGKDSGVFRATKGFVNFQTVMNRTGQDISVLPGSAPTAVKNNEPATFSGTNFTKPPRSTAGNLGGIYDAQQFPRSVSLGNWKAVVVGGFATKVTVDVFQTVNSWDFYGSVGKQNVSGGEKADNFNKMIRSKWITMEFTFAKNQTATNSHQTLRGGTPLIVETSIVWHANQNVNSNLNYKVITSMVIAGSTYATSGPVAYPS